MLRSNTTITRQGLDITPRYAPDVVMTLKGPAPVSGAVFHPTPPMVWLRSSTLELQTREQSRWYPVERAYINSELRMVVIGFPALFEEMSAWEIVPEGRE